MLNECCHLVYHTFREFIWEHVFYRQTYTFCLLKLIFLNPKPLQTGIPYRISISRQVEAHF